MSKLNRKQALAAITDGKSQLVTLYKALEALEKQFSAMRGPGRPKSNGKGRSEAPAASKGDSSEKAEEQFEPATQEQLKEIEALLERAEAIAVRKPQAKRNVSFLRSYLRKVNLKREGAQSVIENTGKQLLELEADGRVPEEVDSGDDLPF